MNPVEFVERLKNEWGLETTRRTVLQYEKDRLIPAPRVETGKSKEYFDESIADFIASWCLIHGDYGVKLKTVETIRYLSVLLLSDFGRFWRLFMGDEDDNDLSLEFAKSKNDNIYIRPCDQFIFYWIMIHQGVLSEDTRDKDQVKQIIAGAGFDKIPLFAIRVFCKLTDDGKTVFDGFNCVKPELKSENGGAITVILENNEGKKVFFQFVNPKFFKLLMKN